MYRPDKQSVQRVLQFLEQTTLPVQTKQNFKEWWDGMRSTARLGKLVETHGYPEFADKPVYRVRIQLSPIDVIWAVDESDRIFSIIEIGEHLDVS